MATSEQQVIRLVERNGFGGIKFFTEKIPKAGKHEVLVKVRSVSLNYRDIAVAYSKYPFPVKDNVVPASDAAGEIVEVGEGVSGFSIGDKVISAVDQTNLYGPLQNWNNALGAPLDGVLREYIVVPASAAIKLPESSLSWAQWSALVATGVTAWNVLYGNIPLRPGQTVLFLGTGGVSITGLIIAKAAGAKTIITSSSDEKLKYVKQKYGADYTINYKNTPDWGAKAMEITNGRGVDYVFENGGSGTIKQSIDAVAMGGNVSIIGFLSIATQAEMPDITGLALYKGCVVRGINAGSKQLLEQVVDFVGKHNLQVPVEKTFNFNEEEVVRAYEYMASGQHIGKICINVA